MQKNFNPHHENRTAFTGIPKIRQEEHMQELDYAGIGMRIRAARKSKGWSQDKVAAECGISLSFMGHIERGTRSMSLETFASLCNILGAGADELLWGMVNPPQSVLEMWNLPDKKKKTEKANPGTGHPSSGAEKKNRPDSYAMYVKIMRSVAEIMNEH
jgi:transcriptional regulator with XRE-family HTH domain